MTLPTPGADLARQSLGRIARLGETPRFWRLQAHEALWMGGAYDTRPSFWDTSVPVRERAPVIQSQVIRTAGVRLAQMVFGERTFPTVTTRAVAYGVGLSDAQRAALDALLKEIIDVASVRRRAREHLLNGLKVGSACALLGLRNGRPRVELWPAKWCTPTLDADGAPTALLIEYRYPDPADPKRLLVYRREIADGLDRVWQPRPAEDDTDWSKVPVVSQRKVPPCVIVWTRNLAGGDVSCGAEIDGVPLAAGLEDEVEALDLSLSMRYRNGLYNGDPQMVRIIGGEPAPGQPVAPLGPEGREGGATEARFSWLNSVLPQGWRLGGEKTATKKGPGTVWSISAPGDAKLLESTGSGATILDGSVREIRRVLLDAMGVVIADPETMGRGDLSARALTLLHAPMLDTVSCLREDYGAALCQMLDGLCRLLSDPEVAAAGVHLTSYPAAVDALRALYRPAEGGGSRWMGVPIDLKWGEPFEPNWSDVEAAMRVATQGVQGGVLSRRVAAQMLAPVLGIESVDTMLRDLDGDETATADAVQRALAPTIHNAVNGAPPQTPRETDDAGG